MYKKIQYNKDLYNFRLLLENFYNVKKLENLHETLSSFYFIPDDLRGLGQDTTSINHKRFYEKLDSGWAEIESIYRNFIIKVVKPLFPVEKELIYQAFPSFRIQYPNNRAITTVHFDNDGDHGHPIGEINFLIPITEMFGSNAPWVETFPGMSDFSPMEGVNGDLFMWDGNRCAHFNKHNDTGQTRVSFDFRVLPAKFYNPEYSKTTATTKKKFLIGEYYKTA